MFGWLSCAAVSASRRKRELDLARGTRAPGGSSLIATCRLSRRSRGAIDDAHAAAPDLAVELVVCREDALTWARSSSSGQRRAGRARDESARVRRGQCSTAAIAGQG